MGFFEGFFRVLDGCDEAVQDERRYIVMCEGPMPSTGHEGLYIRHERNEEHPWIQITDRRAEAWRMDLELAEAVARAAREVWGMARVVDLEAAGRAGEQEEVCGG